MSRAVLKNAAYTLAIGIPLLALTACGGHAQGAPDAQDCSTTFDGCPQLGLVGSLYQGVAGLSPPLLTTVTAYRSFESTLMAVATMPADSYGDFDLNVEAGPYLLCVAAAGCSADDLTSSCCTLASAPAGYVSWMWSSGKWNETLP